MRRVLAFVLAVLAFAVPHSAAAAPGDPVSGGDVIEDGASWKAKTWAHFGNWTKGEVEAESWVDVHWPCFSATDEDQDCAVEDVRGHGLVRKLSKVSRTEIDFTRLGRYPSGVLAVNDTNLNSGTLPVIEHRTPWVATEQFCGADSFRAWNRVTFAVRWSDNWLTTGLSLLSDPTDSFAQEICSMSTLSAQQRSAVRSDLMEAAG
jgi:hypothetical protein